MLKLGTKFSDLSMQWVFFPVNHSKNCFHVVLLYVCYCIGAYFIKRMSNVLLQSTFNDVPQTTTNPSTKLRKKYPISFCCGNCLTKIERKNSLKMLHLIFCLKVESKLFLDGILYIFNGSWLFEMFVWNLSCYVDLKRDRYQFWDYISWIFLWMNLEI